MEPSNEICGVIFYFVLYYYLDFCLVFFPVI